MPLTLSQFKELDQPLLTRAIAEVVMGWTLKGKQYWFGDKREKYSCQFGRRDKVTDEFIWNDTSDIFSPLTSIEDAVLAVSKLDDVNKCRWSREYCDLVSKVGETYFLYLIANASAETRILALINTMPSILERYRELGGKI